MVFRPWLWSHWECPQCGAELEFDFGRRTVISLMGGILGIGPAIFFAMVDMWWGVLPALGIYSFIWSFDSVRLRRLPSATHSQTEHLG